MKKIIVALFSSFILSSCANSKMMKIDGQYIEVEPYGWANKDAKKIDGVVYECSIGNMIWSVILCETVIAPIVFTGWYLFEPVRYEPKK